MSSEDRSRIDWFDSERIAAAESTPKRLFERQVGGLIVKSYYATNVTVKGKLCFRIKVAPRLTNRPFP